MGGGDEDFTQKLLRAYRPIYAKRLPKTRFLVSTLFQPRKSDFFPTGVYRPRNSKRSGAARHCFVSASAVLVKNIWCAERENKIREEKRKTKPRRAGQPCLTVFVHLKSSVRPLDSLRGCSARWLEQIPLSSWENICLNFERRGLFMKGIEPSYRESGRMQMLGQSSEMGTPDAKGYF